MSTQGSSGESFSADTLSSLISLQESDQTSPSQGAHGLQKAFKTLDSDGDGALSTDELTSALTNALGDSSDVSSAVSTLVSAADSNGDGAVSSDEFTAMAKASRPHGPHPGGPPPSGEGGGGGVGGAGGSSGASGVFETLDTNQDGVVSAAELAAADTSGADATSAASSLISDADADGSGSLSGDEFTDMLKKTQASASNDATGAAGTLTSAVSGSTLASDLMQKLLSQLESAQAKTATGSVSVAA